ncbi:MAG TPA: helix-turn-helix domain-containing protein [Actinophytocola sp.]|uniref:nSTAND1 domain-containing NTPase n=1 Tax=Actinophytocola sp. TaxID=1872138 RepID=UPI002DB6F5C1|nr:helix-turn-helix domain-containing protein [Actinophytocola sp.]HEU5472703.1 helix-turn-helix domain-containing protein [Actinophytocola sp.]
MEGMVVMAAQVSVTMPRHELYGVVRTIPTAFRADTDRDLLTSKLTSSCHFGIKNRTPANGGTGPTIAGTDGGAPEEPFVSDTNSDRDPAMIATSIRSRQDFAHFLTELRERAGFTVRDVAKAVGIPDSTIGGYFGGRHLPPIKPARLFTDILRVCGVDSEDEFEAWRQALGRVRRAPGRRPSDAPVPYRGLESFQPEHAQWFHGRDKLARVLVERVAHQWPHGGPVIVVGPSGSGKSSLLRAGLIPAFCGCESPVAGVPSWQAVLFTPGAHPTAELDGQLARVSGDDVGLLIVVDQFEELFTLCSSYAERRAFLTALSDAQRSSRATLVVLGLRADFYPHASRYPELVDALQDAQVLVGPMSKSELRHAIVEPARTARIDVDEGLVELLLRELEPSPHGSPESAHEPGALPLLSHALHATWQRARRGTMTIVDYTATGGISGAIAYTADAVFDSLTEAQQPVARRLLLRLVHLGDRVADTRRHVPYTEILPEGTNDEAAAVSEVLDTFVEQRLITADTETVNITHEALLTAWPRLRGWIDADRAGLRIHGQLAQDAKTWREADRDVSALYRGGRLITTQEWATDPDHRRDLNPLEREFLDASIHQQDTEQRAQRRRTRQLRRLVAALTALVLIAAGLTTYVFRQRATAITERDMAISRQVAGEANRLRDHDVALAKQLAVAAYAISPTPEARGSLLDATANTSATRIVGPEGAMQALAVTPNGQLMATGGTDKTVRLWRLGHRSRATPLGTPLTGPTETVFTASFSPDAHLLAAAGGDRTVRLWNITNPTAPVPLNPLPAAGNTIYSIAFSPDGRMLAAGSADNQIHLWNLTNPTVPVSMGSLSGFTDYVQTVGFSTDGATLAAGSADGTVRLWDTSSGIRAEPLGAALTGPARKVFSVAFSPDGHTLAAGSADKNVYLWNIARRDAPKPLGDPLTGATSWINAIAFSPDGQTLAAGSSDASVRLWDLATRTTSLKLPHPSPVTALSYTTDGMTLATGATDGVARLWTIPGPIITDSADTIFNAIFGPDGKTLITGSGATDAKFRLWDITDIQRPTRLGPPRENPIESNRAVGSTALTPDGRTLASGGVDGRVQLWNIEDPEHATPLGPPLPGPTAQSQFVTFSPNGRLLAASGDEHTVWLWDITNRTHPGPPTAITGPSNNNLTLAFSPDSQTLAAGSLDKTVWLWDITNPTSPSHLATLTGPVNFIYSVAFSPDGHTLAASSADKTVRFWDITNRAHPTPLGPILTGPSNYIYNISFRPDGRMLAASAADQTIWLWDITDFHQPEHLATLTVAGSAVNSVMFSPDGHIIAGSSYDRTARLWLVDPEQAITYICTISGDPITPAEWNQYIKGIPYRAICPP